MIAITAEQIESCLDYERFQHAKWTPIPVKGNYPRLAIGTVGLAGREAGSWIATHATDAFNPPWASDVVAYPKFPFPRQASEAAAIEAEIEVVVERCEREMRLPGSKVELRTLVRAIAALKTFGGRLSFEKYAAETAAQKNRSIPKMRTLRNAEHPAKKFKPNSRVKSIYAARRQNPEPVTVRRTPCAATYFGGEHILVPIPPETRVSLEIQVADVFKFRKAEKTRWMAAIDLGITCGPGGYGGSIMTDVQGSPGTKGFPTRTAALVNACNDAIEHLELRAKQFHKSPAVCRKLRTAIQSIEYFRASLAPFVPASGEKSSALQVIEPAAGPLSHDEAKKLQMCETVIERNLHSFVDVGAALATIQIGRLYRETHGTFEAYCQEKFEIGRQHAYRLIEATNVVKDLSPNGDSDEQFLPQTESQARALAKIKEPEKRKEVWEDIVASHPTVTAKVIEDTVAKILEKCTTKSYAAKAVHERKRAKKAAAKSSFLDEDLAYIRRTVQTVADEWNTKHQRQQICDLLRRMVKELTVK